MNPLRAADEAGDAVRSVIRAYHGSPHDFDRFDASKIDTGEGAQAYGHGLYFAGNEDVARSYREGLSRNSFLIEGASLPMTESIMDEIGIDTVSQGIIRRAIRDGADPRDKLRQMRSGYGPLSARHNRLTDAINILDSAKGKIMPNPGRMYEVEIGHPEDALLDWDRPLISQGAIARERLSPFRTSKYDLAPSDGTDYETGATALHRIAHAFDNDMSEASAALQNAGIPGIRYLDGGSRRAGQGTRNYVMFPGAEDSIRILRKYAIPGAVGTGVASQYDGDR